MSGVIVDEFRSKLQALEGEATQLELIDGLPEMTCNWSLVYNINALDQDYCGGVFGEGAAGWGLDSESLVLHYYGRYDSVAACGHYARPDEFYCDGLEELYLDATETWYDAEYCPECRTGIVALQEV